MNTFYDEELLNNSILQYINIDFEKSPHALIGGSTGSGKTTALKLLLARISKDLPNSQFTISDYKGDSAFAFLNDCPRFYRFDNCYEGLCSFYNYFLEVQRSGQKVNHFYVFDEWASFLMSLEKKEAEDAKKKLSILLNMGRSYGIFILLSQQRLDAEYFGKTRDNFNIVLILGNSSKEVQEMFFHDYKDTIVNDRGRGTGYMLLNGCTLKKIIVPRISSMEKIDMYIKEATLR